MATADQQLATIRIKIEWAKHHVRDLADRIRLFNESGAYEIIANDDPQLVEAFKGLTVHHAMSFADDPRNRPANVRYRLFCLKINDPPVAIALTAWDAVGNLRSALDHLVYQLVEANGSKHLRQHSFPIFKTREDHERTDARRVKGISESALKLINELQPYSTQDFTLWGLNELRNTHEHRFVASIGHVHGPIHVNLDGMTLPLRPATKPIKNGDPFFKVPVGSDFDKDIKVAVDVAFGEVEVFEGQPLLPTLNRLADFVDAIVEKFRPHLTV